MKGKVYLICNPANDTFKIGVTKRDVEKRLKELQTGNSNEVFILDYYETEHTYKIESMLHRKFYSKNVMNEWFKLDSDDISSFRTLCEKYESIISEFENQPEIL